MALWETPLPASARFMPIYLRYKWTKWRFQEARGFSAKVRTLALPSQCKGRYLARPAVQAAQLFIFCIVCGREAEGVLAGAAG